MKNELIILTAQSQGDYELIDAGDNEKLERFGEVILRRPDPQALWPKNLNKSWADADAEFENKSKAGWKYNRNIEKRWAIDFAGLKFWIKPSTFKHVGIFPEQATNWSWMSGLIKNNGKTKVLNLFGYTGGATLACAKAGAEVVHIDGSKVAIGWARENAELSGLASKPVRWILDDAVAFLRREVKRGNKYDGIIMDPPAFGHGPDGEVWKIEEDFLKLLNLCQQVLSDNPLFVLINGYASGYSALAYKNNLEKMMAKFDGKITCGELTIAEKESERLLPAGIFARWERN